MTKDDILKYLKEHQKEFQQRYNLDEIGLFGSYARDEATRKSDIDIFVKMEPSLHAILDIKEKLESEFKTKVDIVRMREKMNLYLKKRILKDGIYVR